ncbi:hypothetical protein KAT72_08765, partial [Aeromonas popoffii]
QLDLQAQIFFRLNVFCQLSGECFEFVLVHLLTHEGILLKSYLFVGGYTIGFTGSTSTLTPFISGAIHFVHCTLRLYHLLLCLMVAVVMAATSLLHQSPSNKDAIVGQLRPLYP